MKTAGTWGRYRKSLKQLGKSIEELEQNLLDALEMVIDYHREQTNILYKGRKIIKRKLNLA